MSQACIEWQGDIGAYIVGALDPNECVQLRRHLRDCRACWVEYHDLAPVRDLLGSLLGTDRSRFICRTGLRRNQYRSDRAIAEVTALAHKIVGAIRCRPDGKCRQVDTRISLNGRVRPLDGAARRRAAE